MQLQRCCLSNIRWCCWPNVRLTVDDGISKVDSKQSSSVVNCSVGRAWKSADWFTIPLEGEKFTLHVSISSSQSYDSLVLCWVSESGVLHHFYKLQAGETHQEITYPGHSFVVFVQHSATNEGAKYISDIASSKIIGAFRATQSIPVDDVLAVKISSNGTRMEINTESMPDCEYRVIARCKQISSSSQNQDFSASQRKAFARQVELPAPNLPWELCYEIVCPAYPKPFNPQRETFYVWGDVSFDCYDNCAPFEIHKNKMNQIVPQIMTGCCLDGSSSHNQYRPSWNTHSTWIAQAQYYWQDEKGESNGSHAMCGSIVAIQPGEHIQTRIRYLPSNGSIHVSIGVVCDGDMLQERTSAIVIQKPFPHDDILLKDDVNKTPTKSAFNDWVAFSILGAQASNTTGLLCRPELNIEYKGSVTIDGLKSICPLKVVKATLNESNILNESPNSIEVLNFKPSGKSARETGNGIVMLTQIPQPPIVFE